MLSFSRVFCYSKVVVTHLRGTHTYVGQLVIFGRCFSHTYVGHTAKWDSAPKMEKFTHLRGTPVQLSIQNRAKTLEK